MALYVEMMFDWRTCPGTTPTGLHLFNRCHSTLVNWTLDFRSDEYCTIERGVGARQESAFIRPKDQPKLEQVQVFTSMWKTANIC